MAENPKSNTESFIERGGLWVLAQIPILLLAFLVPIWTGAAGFVPRQPLQIAGVVLAVVGTVVCVLGLRQLGAALTPFPRPLEQAALRSSGVYALVRHPIYSGLLIAVVGWSLWWLSTPGLLVAVAAGIFFDRKAAYEEIWLGDKYREQYAEYRKRVKKFLPWIY